MTKFITILCPTCCIEFGIIDPMNTRRKEDSTDFWCPNGHTLKYSKRDSKETEIEDLKIRIKDLKAELVLAKKKIEELTLEIEIWKPTSDFKHSQDSGIR